MTVHTKRVYEASADSDGFRVLVDRVWPRGVSKEKADVALWLKQIGPSTALRKWFDHQDERYDEFKRRYSTELKTGAQHDDLVQLKEIVASQPVVTLVYGAKNTVHNQAIVLQSILDTSA